MKKHKNNKTKFVTNPYYTYGILYISENFKNFEKLKGKRYQEYRKKWTDVIKFFDP